MKNLLNKMILPQDKANHFVWTVVVLDVIMATILGFDYLFKLDLRFIFIVSVSFILAAILGLVKEARDYATGKGTPSFMDTLANLFGLIVAFGLVVMSAASHG